MKKLQTEDHEQNRTAWDARARRQDVFTRPANQAELDDPLKKLDPRGWYGPSVVGKRVLCLGAGGGRHGPLLARAGAEVTVVDLSPLMLELDHQMAQRHTLKIHTVQASIDDLSPLTGQSFDLVIQPVSSCYVPSVIRVYQEVARVLVTGGTYVSQHKTPTNLQCATEFTSGGYNLRTPYYSRAPLPAAPASRFREAGTLEFIHRWEELVGGLCRSGFTLEDLVEVQRGTPDAEPGSFEHRCHYVAPYVRLLARRKAAIIL